jgi:hypothetical protein
MLGFSINLHKKIDAKMRLIPIFASGTVEFKLCVDRYFW